MAHTVPAIWIGIDAGKVFHWAQVLDTRGTQLLSRRVKNDEADLQELIDEVLSLAGGSPVVWAVDQTGGGAVPGDATVQDVRRLAALAVRSRLRCGV